MTGSSAKSGRRSGSRPADPLGRFDLTGRAALVTGAGGGLGRHFAVALASVGATVWCADIDGRVAKETADISALGHYVAAKAGVIGFTKQVAVEYGREGVRSNAIAPGWHPGGRLAKESGLDEDQKRRHFERICDLVPMGRVGRQEELQSLLLYLASDASSYVTGQVIAHDGGWTAF